MTLTGLCLFDIDKTLIKNAPKEQLEAFSVAFEKVFGVKSGIDAINYHGMTDRKIIIEVMKKVGLPKKEIESKLDDCIKVMEEHFLEKAGQIDVELLDGAFDLLTTLRNQGYLLGVVTGNIEIIAKEKLIKSEIDNFFQVGAFGSDHIDRVELVKLAIRQAKRNFAFRLSGDNVFLFGDAPQDMEAAKKAGVLACGVTTGIYSKKDLVRAGADWTVSWLQDKKIFTE